MERSYCSYRGCALFKEKKTYEKKGVIKLKYMWVMSSYISPVFRYENDILLDTLNEFSISSPTLKGMKRIIDNALDPNSIRFIKSLKKEG